MIKRMELWLATAALALTLVGTAPAQMALPNAHIYPEVTVAKSEIAAAMVKARREHKYVLLDFGGDWCGDCQVLNYYMHQEPNASLLAANFVLVDVNIGHIDQNLDLGPKYGVNLKKGVPALSVVRPDGTVVYGQKEGEFENMRTMKSEDLTAFLNRWKPQPRR